MPDAGETPIDVKSGKVLADGRLELTFQQDPEGRSYLAEQYYTYPFHVCRAQYPDTAQPDMATLYLQSSSGGIFRGDRLTTKILGKENTRSHVTTQASTVIHSMEQDSAQQSLEINGEAGALIEYLPDCTILFPEAKLQSSITVTRHPDCDVVIGDSFLAHDPDNCGKPFGWLQNELFIRRPDGQVDVIDRFTVTGEQFHSGETSEIRSYAVHGTFVVISKRSAVLSLVDTLRLCMADHDDIFAGVSRLPNDAGCLVRYLAIDGIAAKKFMTDLWINSRIALTGNPPELRKK